MAIPQRTASSAKSGWCSAPAELHACRRPGETSNRDTVSRKVSNCRRVIASSDSERAKSAHAQDLLGVDEAAELGRLLERRHPEPGGAALEGGVRDRHRAVAVAARLDHREELRPAPNVAQDAVAVGADGAEVDLSPTQGALQSPPCLRTFITTGIAGRRSLASRPESPMRSAMRRPAAAWTYTPVTAAE